jgi:hypothetical protein
MRKRGTHVTKFGARKFKGIGISVEAWARHIRKHVTHVTKFGATMFKGYGISLETLTRADCMLVFYFKLR